MQPSPATALYNFDHGFDRATTFRFGPYEFEVTEAHAAARRALPWHAQVHQRWVASDRVLVETTPVQPGTAGETATVRCVEALSKDAPYLGGPPDPDGIGELCTLLSFLTGRRVLRAQDRTTFDGLHYGERVVGQNFFWSVGLFWPDLAAVHRESLAPAVWAIAQLATTNDLIAQHCYASAALDRVVSNWYAAQPKSRDPALLARIDEAVQDATVAIQTRLGDEQVAADALPRLRGLFQPSAMAKLTAYLHSLQVISDPLTKTQSDRIKLVNMVRNLAVHTADVPSKLHRDPVRRGEIASVVRAVVVDLATLRLTQVMGIQDWLIERSREEVRSFFATGEYNEFRVFDESYETYLQRLGTEGLVANDETDRAETE